MSPDDPRHGTYAGARAHQAVSAKAGGKVRMCKGCRAAYNQYQRDRRGASRAVSAEQVAPLLRDLLKWATRLQLAEGLGCHRSRVDDILAGRYKTVRDAGLALRILEMHKAGWRPATGAPRRVVDPTGTRRRLQALYCMGMPVKHIALRLGMDYQGIRRFIYNDAPVTLATARRVAVLYRECATKPWVPTTPRERRASDEARAAGRKHGFADAFAWTNIDDPNEVPNV